MRAAETIQIRSEAQSLFNILLSQIQADRIIDARFWKETKSNKSMELPVTNRPDFLAGGEPARLIPITADSAREQKSVSIILAGLRSVLELCQSLLRSQNVRVGIYSSSRGGLD